MYFGWQLLKVIALLFRKVKGAFFQRDWSYDLVYRNVLFESGVGGFAGRGLLQVLVRSLVSSLASGRQGASLSYFPHMEGIHLKAFKCKGHWTL